MKRIKITIQVIIIIFTLLVPLDRVHAFPPLPSSFYGTVKYNMENLPEGTIIQALIDGEVIAEAQTMVYEGESVYVIDVPGDDSSTKEVEGGTEGSQIHFMVGDLEVNETSTWSSGTNVELNLTITSDSTPKQAEPTKTPVPTQTPISISTDPNQQQTTPDPTVSATVQPTSDGENQIIPESEQTESTLDAVEVADVSDNPSDHPADQSLDLDESNLAVEDEPDTNSNHLWLILIICGVIGGGILIVFILRKKSKNNYENLLF